MIHRGLIRLKFKVLPFNHGNLFRIGLLGKSPILSLLFVFSLAINPKLSQASPLYGFYQCQSNTVGSVEVEGDAVYRHRSSTFSWVWNPDGRIQVVFPGDDDITILNTVNSDLIEGKRFSLHAVAKSEVFVFQYDLDEDNFNDNGVFAMSRLALSSVYGTPGQSGLIGQMIHGNCKKLGDLKTSEEQ